MPAVSLNLTCSPASLLLASFLLFSFRFFIECWNFRKRTGIGPLSTTIDLFCVRKPQIEHYNLVRIWLVGIKLGRIAFYCTAHPCSMVVDVDLLLVLNNCSVLLSLPSHHFSKTPTPFGGFVCWRSPWPPLSVFVWFCSQNNWLPNSWLDDSLWIQTNPVKTFFFF